MTLLKQHINIAIIGLIAMFFFITSCKNDVVEVQEATVKLDLPLRVQKGIHYEYTDSSYKQLDIVAPIASDFSNHKEPYREFPEGIEVTFYNKFQVQEAFLRANYAKQFDNDSKWEARGDVIVINKKGEKLNTEQLLWDQKEGIISSEKFVKITSDGNVITGYGFESDQAFKSWRIFNIEGEFDLKEDEDQNNTD